MSLPTRDATSVVLDVSPKMPAHLFEQGKHIAIDIILDHLIFKSKACLMGLTFTGTPDTDNKQGLKNIAVKQPMRKVDREFLKMALSISQQDADRAATNVEVLESLLIGLKVLLDETQGKRFQRKLVFITYADGDISEEFQSNLKLIRDTCRANFISLHIIGLGFSEHNLFNAEDRTVYADQFDSRSLTHSEDPDLNWAGFSQKEKNERGLKFLVGSIMEDVDGTRALRQAYSIIPADEQQATHPDVIFAYHELLQKEIFTGNNYEEAVAIVHSAEQFLNDRMESLRKQEVAQHTSAKLVFTLGPDVAIPGNVFIHTTASTSSSGAIKFTKRGPKGEELTQKRRYFTLADPDIELQPQQRIKAYRYGRSIINSTEVDQVGLKLKSTKGMELLGFIPLDQIKSHAHLGNVRIFSPLKDDVIGNRTLRCLNTAMQVRKVACLLRFVWRDNTDPQLVAGYSCLTDNSADNRNDDKNIRQRALTDGCAMYFVPLPFAEDFRKMRFADFSTAKFKPEKLSAMNEMIDAMTNTDYRKSDIYNCSKDDETQEQRENFYHPPEVHNPTMQLFQHMLRTKLKQEKDIIEIAPTTSTADDDGSGNNNNNNNNMMMMNNNNNNNNNNQQNNNNDDNDSNNNNNKTTADEAWTVPVPLRKRSCAWSSEDNILYDFFERTVDQRRGVRQLFNSKVDMKSKTLSMNAKGRQQANINNDDDDDDFEDDDAGTMRNNNNNRNNQNTNNTDTRHWFDSSRTAMYQRKQEENRNLEHERVQQNLLLSSSHHSTTGNNNTNNNSSVYNNRQGSLSSQQSDASIKDGAFADPRRMMNNNNNNNRGATEDSNGNRSSLPSAAERYKDGEDEDDEWLLTEADEATRMRSHNPNLDRELRRAKEQKQKLMTSTDLVGTFRSLIMSSNNDSSTVISQASSTGRNDNHHHNNSHSSSEKALFLFVCDQLEEVIVHLLKTGSANHSKILLALDEMREQCVKRGTPEKFNNCLVTIYNASKTLANKSRDHKRQLRELEEQKLQEDQEATTANNNSASASQQQQTGSTAGSSINFGEIENLFDNSSNNKQKGNNTITTASSSIAGLSSASLGQQSNNNDQNNNNDDDNTFLDFTRSENDFHKSYLKTERVRMISIAECGEGGASEDRIEDFLNKNRNLAGNTTSSGSRSLSGYSRQSESVDNNNHRNEANENNNSNSHQVAGNNNNNDDEVDADDIDLAVVEDF